VASWTEAVSLELPRPRRLARPRRLPRVAERTVAGGVLWIVVVAVLLAGIVALNVAVLRLNVRLDELFGENRLQEALPKIEALARQRGFVPAPPETTTYVELGRTDR
jgi:hypothetical protein